MCKRLKKPTSKGLKVCPDTRSRTRDLLISAVTSTVSRSNHLSYVRVGVIAHNLISCYCDTKVDCECYTLRPQFSDTQQRGQQLCSRVMTPIPKVGTKACDQAKP